MSTLPEFKTRLRGTPAGYDVYVCRPNASDTKIGSVQKEWSRQISWEAVRNGKVIHKGLKTRKLAKLVVVNAWVASL